MVVCWGNNEYGQLGDGSVVDRPAPVMVPGLTGVSAVGLGYNHSCALLDSGSVRCWGNNYQGQLGDGSFTAASAPAYDVVGVTDAVAIGIGGFTSCAILDDGSSVCWGNNDSGQLGTGDYPFVPAPSTLVWPW